MRAPEVHRLVDSVVRSFSAPSVSTGRPSAGLGAYAYLREAFVAAGASRVRQILRPRNWLQFGLQFGSARSLQRFLSGGRLRGLVEEELDRGTLEHFFFMRKPPGLRVRFCSARPAPSLEREIRLALDAARRDGALRRFELGMYDEETHQFGGERGIDLFHRFSTYDSLALLEHFELAARGEVTLDATALSALATTNLVRCLSGDAWEEWDAWCELRLTGRLPERASRLGRLLDGELQGNRELMDAVVHHPRRVIAGLTRAERRVWSRYTRGNKALTTEFARVVREGQLDCPPRKVLPFFIVFHWNRAGLGPMEQTALAYFIRELLDPKRETGTP